MPASSPVDGVLEDGSSSSVSLSNESRWFSLSTSSSVSAAELARRLAEVIIVTPECEFGIAAAPPIVSLLISTPINAKGAQPLIAHGIPHTATRKVANAREWARGAKIIVAANMICEINQAVWRSGRNAVTALRAAAMPGGGRGVNRVRLVS